jgi:uncharacterized protein YbjT (DUF2867 family)
MKFLVSGAYGFIGRALCAYLSSSGHKVVPAVRRPSFIKGEHLVQSESSWRATLKGCESVVHLTGRAHVLQDHEPDHLHAFRLATVGHHRTCQSSSLG